MYENVTAREMKNKYFIVLVVLFVDYLILEKGPTYIYLSSKNSKKDLARKLPKTGNGHHSKIQVGSQTKKWADKWQFEDQNSLIKMNIEQSWDNNFVQV